MKIFWDVSERERNVIRGKAAKYAIDRKTKKRYEIGEGYLYDKIDYPKNLLENIKDSKTGKARYDFVYEKVEPDRIEQPLFGEVRKVYTKIYDNRLLEKEFLNSFGLWEVKGLHLYTTMLLDYVRDKRTGKEYPLGDMEIFYNEDETPFPLLEYTDQYEYIIVERDSTRIDAIEDIRNMLFVHSIFNKK